VTVYPERTRNASTGRRILREHHLNRRITRFIDLAASHVDDEPACGVTVSANGAAYLVKSAPYTVDTLFGSFGAPTRVNLVHRNPRVATATLTTEHEYLADTAIADTGAVFWAIDTAVSGTVPTQDNPCGTPTSGPCTGHVDSVTAFAVATSARQRFAVEASESSILGAPERSSISNDGRFLTYVGSGHPTRCTCSIDTSVATKSSPDTGRWSATTLPNARRSGRPHRARCRSRPDRHRSAPTAE
jgi:hypothetical protein